MIFHRWWSSFQWLSSDVRMMWESVMDWSCPVIGQMAGGGGTSAAWGAPLWAPSWTRSAGNAHSPTRSRWVASCRGVRRESPRMESQVRRHLLAVSPVRPHSWTKLWFQPSLMQLVERITLESSITDDSVRVCCSCRRGSRGRAWPRLGSSAYFPASPGEDGWQPEPQPGPLRSHRHWPAGARWLTPSPTLWQSGETR